MPSAAERGPKRAGLDPARPYAVEVERERTAGGAVEDVGVVFLTNRECPFRCVMCDLWRSTLDETPPPGAVAGQVEWALSELPPVRHLKLYNAGSFFDPQAIPPQDLERIAGLVAHLRTVTVECHPRLVGPACEAFAARLRGRLEVALGLETADPVALARLGKGMTVADFERAAAWLSARGMGVRAFVLVRPPFQDEAAGLAWACRSVEVAQAAGADPCVLIPTRSGNPELDELAAQGLFSTPSLATLEAALDHGVRRGRGRVFADLWDAPQLFGAEPDAPLRLARLDEVNRTQHLI